LADAKRALFAANAAKNGANISQHGNFEDGTDAGGCSLSSGQWLWIRITGTGDTFGRF
jgi:hypothetical protein